MSITSGNSEHLPGNKTKYYQAHNIRVLTPLQAIQMRPAMYLGDVGRRGLHQLLEIVLLRIMAKHLFDEGRVEISLLEDNSIVVTDNLPEVIEEDELGQMDFAPDLNDYKRVMQSYGLSLAVVNALSSFLEISTYVEEQVYAQRFEEGIVDIAIRQIEDKNLKGTKIHFKPAETCFVEIIFDFQYIAARLWELACFNKGASFCLQDQRDLNHHGESKYQVFQTEKGILDFIPTLHNGSDWLLSNAFVLDQVDIKIAFNYNTSCVENVKSYVNNTLTSWGGTHLTGFRRALTYSLKSFARIKGIAKAKQLTGTDFKKGLVAIISINLTNARFDGASKVKLWSPEVVSLVYTTLSQALRLFWESNPSQTAAIIYKAISDQNNPLIKNNDQI